VDDLSSFALMAVVAIIPMGLGVVSALMARRSWNENPARRGRTLCVVAAVIDAAVVSSVIPELAAYPIYHNGLMHAPATARLFAVFAALFCLGFVFPLAIPLVRNTGPRRVRLLGALSIGLALLPWPLHGLTLAVITSVFGIHFFWR
jgi:hypothetical protein